MIISIILQCLAGWLGRLAVFFACWPAGQQARSLASWFAGCWLAGCLVGCLAGWLSSSRCLPRLALPCLCLALPCPELPCFAP